MWELRYHLTLYIFLGVIMVYTMKLERNLWLGCYSYFILLLDKRKEKLLLLGKWSLGRCSQAVPRHSLSPGVLLCWTRENTQVRVFLHTESYRSSSGFQLPDSYRVVVHSCVLVAHSPLPSFNSRNKSQWVNPLLLWNKAHLVIHS